jgi:hypothetical protein
MNHLSMSSGISCEIHGGLLLERQIFGSFVCQLSNGEMVLLFRIRLGIGKLLVSIF